MSRIGWGEQREHLGQLAWMARPNDLFPDNFDKHIDIELGAVHYFPKDADEIPRDRGELHWMIRWYLTDWYDTPTFRVVELRFERQDTTSKRTMGVFQETYTNWGPITRSIKLETQTSSLWLKLGSLALEKRKVLEYISASEPVKVPISYDWNCQEWTKSVLKKSVTEGLFSQTIVSNAVRRLEVCATFHH